MSQFEYLSILWVVALELVGGHVAVPSLRLH